MTLFAQVIGDPIAQSKSPIIHNFWIEKLGLKAEYHSRQVANDSVALAAYVASVRNDAEWRGCNVTMPHKQVIIPLLDSLDPSARKIGAVNTVVRQADGLLKGFNTDIYGFLEPLRNILAAKHLFRMARVIGTGGAARAIVAALAANGFTIVLSGRDTVKARAILDEQAPDGEHHVAPLAHFAPATDFTFDDRENCLDLIVNASPLGMAGQPNLDFHLSHVPPGSIFYDIVTDPVETDLLRRAKAADFPTINGMTMLIGQAAEAFTLFFGQKPPREYDLELRGLLSS